MGEREGETKGRERERGREGWRREGRDSEGGREAVMEEGREAERERDREGGREIAKESERSNCQNIQGCRRQLEVAIALAEAAEQGSAYLCKICLKWTLHDFAY